MERGGQRVVVGKGVLAVVTLSIVVASVLGACPSSCSYPNGECGAANTCVCSAGWTGDDCSFSDTGLENNIAVSSTVGTKQWRYFHFYYQSEQATIRVEVNQTGAGGDVDSYIRRGSYPTRDEYDDRDLTTSRNTVFLIESPRGDYFLGVYGFVGTDFSVAYRVKSRCPNDCSGHGTCQNNNECRCAVGWAGEDCGAAVTSLSSGRAVTSSVELRGWAYFSLRVPASDNHVKVTLTEQEEDKDADVYVRLNALPTRTNYTGRDSGTDLVSQVLFSDARAGNYFIGVYGFRGPVRFDVKAESYIDCPNSCSGRTHGTCSGRVCACNRDYAGDACEEKRSPLALDGRIESGVVQGNMWNYFPMITNTGSNVVVRLTHRETPDSVSGDCDVYINAGSKPTRAKYEYRNIDTNDEVVIVMESPLSQTWYVGIYGYKSCSYELSATVENTCLNGCTDSSHGRCDNGHCVCYDGFVGEDCSYGLSTLFSGQPTSREVVTGDWVYFSIHVSGDGPAVSVQLRETDSAGILALYASYLNTPTQAAYDAFAFERGSDYQRLTLYPGDEADVIIGVYATSLGLNDHSYPFDIVAYQAAI